MNFEPAAVAEKYNPRPQDAAPDLFRARITACAACPAREGHTCRDINQLCSVAARRAAFTCPRRKWPGDPPTLLNPPPGRVPPPLQMTADESILRRAINRVKSVLARKTRAAKVKPSPRFTATIPTPIPDAIRPRYPFEGICPRQPWDYEVTAVIPTINSSDRLPAVVELLRLQTVRPFILLIDTGSAPDHWEKIQDLRAPDVEVHALRWNAIEHSSAAVSCAIDAGVASCRTRFAFFTHDDVFLRKRTALRELRDLAAVHVIAGHQLTKRPHDDWSRMFGHSLLMLDQDKISDLGITWSMRRGMRLFGHSSIRTREELPNFPDTEIGINYLIRLAGITPYFTGTEENYKRNIDDWIDHPRSTAGAALYSPHDLAMKMAGHVAEALRDAHARVDEWRRTPVAEDPRLPDVPAPTRLVIPHFTAGNY